MNELIVVYTIVYSLCMTVFGLLGTFFIQTDTIAIKELLFGEGHSKESALRKINMITSTHFGLMLVGIVTLVYWEGYV